MGNKISHKRYCCRKFRSFKRQATEQGNAAGDLPVAQKALGAVLQSSLPKEKSQDNATRTQNEDIENEIASSLEYLQKSVEQIAVQTTELQDLDEIQPYTEETETKPATMVSPDIVCAPAEGRAAMPQPASGDVGITKPDVHLQAAVETEARDVKDVVTAQAPVEGNSVVRKRPRGKMCKPSPLCRWLKKLKSSA